MCTDLRVRVGAWPAAKHSAEKCKRVEQLVSKKKRQHVLTRTFMFMY
jgi:hypothetical protein